MKSILILTRQPSFAAAIQAAVNSAAYQIIAKEDAWEAESLLARGAIDAAILDVELTDARATRLVEELRAICPTCPLLIYTTTKNWEWEEDAYLLGVAHVLMKPVRARLLNNLLDRVLAPSPTVREATLTSAHTQEAPSVQTQSKSLGLERLRSFAEILPHNLDSGALLREFLMRLRELLQVNRAIVFLRKAPDAAGDAAPGQEDRWLRSACAIGIEQMFLDHFALSLATGIGGSMRRHGRILKATSPDCVASREISREFQLLGVQVAIPILDRQTLVGVAVFDERLTGEPFTNEDLSLIFHMLEEVGVAIRNGWIYGQLRESHAMMADILAQLTSGCMVFGSNLTVLHSNAAARAIFVPPERRGDLEFSDLPQEIGSKIFTVTKHGHPVAPFRYRFSEKSDKFYSISITPFRVQNHAEAPTAALLMVEDITHTVSAQRLEIETSNLRLIKSMAEHLAHEIGNSAVPLSTHQQLLEEKYDDPDFRESLSLAMEDGVKRISRLASQMVFLAREKPDDGESISVSDLISDAFRDAYTHFAGKMPKQLDFEKDDAPFTVSGDRKALKHAFLEVILNALQANPTDPKVAVRVEADPAKGDAAIHVEVRDTGGGFSAEAAERAPDPFFSTRTVGLGLGLTVSRKIIENHNGRIEIPTSKKGEPGLVRIRLPLNDGLETK